MATDDGTVTAQFSNGLLARTICKIPLATFASPDGLGGCARQCLCRRPEPPAPPTSIRTALQGPPPGSVASNSLEASTVDLATEFTNLITTQRAYSASARIVTTADQMLQELEQLPTQ